MSLHEALPDSPAAKLDAPASPFRTPRTAAAYTRVRERLRAQEPCDELGQLDRLSGDELRLLVKMERGWGPSVPQNPHTDHHLPYPQSYPQIQTPNTQGYASGSTQAIHGPVGDMDYNAVTSGAAI